MRRKDMLAPMKNAIQNAKVGGNVFYDLPLNNNVNESRISEPQAKHFELLSREELLALTGTIQPKRMCQWLEVRGWAYEPPARRGDTPKVLRAYRDARLSGLQPDRSKRADYSFMTVGMR